MKRAIIIGCGYTGSALATQLSAASIDVIGVRRHAQEGDDKLPYTTKLLDISSDFDDQLPEAEDAIVYYMVGPPKQARQYDPKKLSHLAPVDRLVNALAGKSIRGLVYLSSTSVYGDTQGDWVDEDTPTTPGSPWGQMRVDIENRFWEAGIQLNAPTTVLRLPEIYGPGRGPIERLRKGYKMRMPERYSNRIHLADLVDILAMIGKKTAPALLVAADGNPAKTQEVYEHVTRITGLVAPIQSTDLPDDPNIRALVTHSKRCRNTRLIQWMDRPLRYPSYKEGLEETLAQDTTQ